MTWILGMLALACCVGGTHEVPPMPAPEPVTLPEPAPAPELIGYAYLEDDGTLVFMLYTDDGGHAQAMFRYPPDHPKYAAKLEHIGGIAPGEQKPVPPYPE